MQDVSQATARAEYGIIVCDHRGAADDKKLIGQHQKLVHSSSSHTSNYKNVIEGLFLVPSHLSIGVQLADMVAGAVWRTFERNDEKWFKHIEPTLRVGPQGKIYGFGLIKMPKSGWQ